MNILEMFIRTSVLTILCLAMIVGIAGTLFVVNVCILEWFGVDCVGEIQKWIIKHSKTK